ncbi:MAG TPA: amidohydrolase family protein [Kofleriaceae bacterium]|nr:amidohydrolase family protein [Kofleriaceae bacterium]
MRSSAWLSACLAALLGAGCTQSDSGTDPGDPGDGKADVWGPTSSKTLVLRGTVVTMDEARGYNRVLDNAAVVIKAGKITAILTQGQALPSGSDVTVLPSATGTSDWVITPGLMNLHNHLAYNTAHIYRDLPLYENTYQWRDEDYYDTHIQLPKRVLGSCSMANDEVDVAVDSGDSRVELSGIIGRFSEVKELAGGTTSTQGSYFGSSIHAGYGKHLVRNVDETNFGVKRVTQDSLGILVSSFDPRALRAKLDAGKYDAWFVHLAEGTDQESADEFDCLDAMGLVRKELALIHGTGLTHEQLTRMGAAKATLVTSPLDNLMYYGTTPDLPYAWKAGVNVVLGTDWSPAGSKNLLAELKVVDLLNKQVWGNYFSNYQILQMVTTNPAQTLAWTGHVGRVKVGLDADLSVFRKRSGGAYRSVIDATEKDVRLVVVGGDPLYGDVDMMKKVKPGDYETLQAGCGFAKAVDITTSNSSVQHPDLTYAQVESTLQDALQFDMDWLYDHYDPARTSSMSRTTFNAEMKDKYPYAMDARDLDPIFVCDDPDFLDEVRTDPNIRTAFNGVCLDLRPWYGGSTSASCGSMPADPHLVTTAEHDGTVPERPAAWCADQDWYGSTLPKP